MNLNNNEKKQQVQDNILSLVDGIRNVEKFEPKKIIDTIAL